MGDLPMTSLAHRSPGVDGGADTPGIIELVLLVSVAETGSLGRAAARHGLTQPAVSMRMSGLERRLGLRLLQRTPAGTSVTAEGQEVVEAARGVLAATDGLLGVTARLRAEVADQLRVASSFTVAEFLLPAWIRRLRQASPDVSLSLEVVNTGRVLDAVSSHGVDIGFAEGLGLEMPGIASTPVITDELVVLVGPKHPWGRRTEAVDGVELSATELIVREPGSGTREVLDAALAPWGGTRTRLELGSSTAVLAAVREGDGPGVVSVLAASADLAAGSLVQVPVRISLERTLRAVWPADVELGRHARQLLAIGKRPVPGAPKETLGAAKQRPGSRLAGQVVPSNHDG